MVYDFKPGSHIPVSVSAEETYHALVAIRQRTGTLTSESVASEVEAERDDHPLSWAFTWDVEAGMHKLHVAEAGTLIRAVVVRDVAPSQRQAVRAFVTLSETHRGPQYEETICAIREPDKCVILLDQIERELDLVTSKQKELLALIRAVSGR